MMLYDYMILNVIYRLTRSHGWIVVVWKPCLSNFSWGRTFRILDYLRCRGKTQTKCIGYIVFSMDHTVLDPSSFYFWFPWGTVNEIKDITEWYCSHNSEHKRDKKKLADKFIKNKTGIWKYIIKTYLPRLNASSMSPARSEAFIA